MARLCCHNFFFFIIGGILIGGGGPPAPLGYAYGPNNIKSKSNQM